MSFGKRSFEELEIDLFRKTQNSNCKIIVRFKNGSGQRKYFLNKNISWAEALEKLKNISKDFCHYMMKNDSATEGTEATEKGK